MRIGIVTCQWAYNYGAVLQAYALARFLSDIGHSVSLLNYQPSYRRGVPQEGIKRFVKPALRYPDWHKGANTFGDFLDQFTPITRPFESLDELREMCPSLDLCLVGSDQVWGFHLPNAYDDVNFLDFLPETVQKASYAASIASPALNEEEKKRLRSKLQKFKAISVRENSGKELLEKAGVANVTTSVDPVYLLDASQWENAIREYAVKDDGEYILVYCFGRPKQIYAYAKKLASKKKCKVYCVSTFWEDRYLLRPDRFFWNCSPFTFVSLIRNASAIVTNSFHGLSFSAIFQKELHMFEKNMPEDTRVKEILENMDAFDCIVSSNTFNYTGAEIDAGNMEKNIQMSKNYLHNITK